MPVKPIFTIYANVNSKIVTATEVLEKVTPILESAKKRGDQDYSQRGTGEEKRTQK